MNPTISWDRLQAIAQQEVTNVMASLPAELHNSAAAVSVGYETVPAHSPAAEGLGDDLLGLFVGPDFANEDEHAALPPQIILFLDSLWEYCAGDEAAYREEVRVTYLHELGHYLGLDEDEVEERGLL